MSTAAAKEKNAPRSELLLNIRVADATAYLLADELRELRKRAGQPVGSVESIVFEHMKEARRIVTTTDQSPKLVLLEKDRFKEPCPATCIGCWHNRVLKGGDCPSTGEHRGSEDCQQRRRNGVGQ